MSETARDRLAELLAGPTVAGAFSASRTAPPIDLQLEVRGVGPIRFPVSQSQAKQLCLVARPAQHGRREQTLLDPRVRDTWEVPKSRVKIDKRRWSQTLGPVLARLGHDLGLPSGRTLRAELHSMLVYAPGQFFVEHQDSEKGDDMIGSLVVGLPSTFKGGALHVRHSGQAAVYRGSKQALSFVAFYGDCRHEVKRVRAGYRIVLTYNLLLGAETAARERELDAELVGGLATCLDEHFASSSSPDRLVYLLDHEYTRRGLDPARLKGADAERAALLAAAAERAGCDSVLALADVHETWSAYEPDGRWDERWHHSRRDYWDEEDEGDADGLDRGGVGEYELQELMDSEVALDSWIDPRDGRVKPVGLSVGGDEVCASTPSGDLEPYSSEYEGYMGNYGNTLDRWYHRGALVLWPHGLAFAIQAEADPSFALDEIATRARAGEIADALAAVDDVAAFWGRVASAVQTRGFFAKALRTARLLGASEPATLLLRPFRLQLVGSGQARALGALVEAYGEPWAQELLAGWSTRSRGYYADGRDLPAWICSLPALCIAFAKAGTGGRQAATLLLRESWAWARQSIDGALQSSSPSRREQSLAALGPSVGAILEGASLIGATDLRDDAVAVLCSRAELLGCAIATLRATPAARWSAAGLDAVATHSAAVLDARLARPERRSDDWSLQLPAGCECELCEPLRAFLADPTRTRLEWPLAKDRRAHVHGRIDRAELPVTHQTRRVGRPYTLVLAKTEALFEREAQQREGDRQNLAWLAGSRVRTGAA